MVLVTNLDGEADARINAAPTLISLWYEGIREFCTTTTELGKKLFIIEVDTVEEFNTTFRWVFVRVLSEEINRELFEKATVPE